MSPLPLPRVQLPGQSAFDMKLMEGLTGTDTHSLYTKRSYDADNFHTSREVSTLRRCHAQRCHAQRCHARRCHTDPHSTQRAALAQCPGAHGPHAGSLRWLSPF